MPENTYLNPAEQAAQEALAHMFRCIDERTSFVFEAGAGAGKTYSLNKSLQKIIATQGRELLRKNQRIACITYTNVAKDEIDKNTDHHPVLLSATIHSFCWSLIKDFQHNLRTLIPTISGRWLERINDAGDVNSKFVNYDLGYPKVDEKEILLHHDDVPALMTKLMEEPKFRAIFSNRYPIIFVDEYQDTNKAFADSLIKHFVDTGNGPLIGFFGDHWQKIYGSSSCGIIQNTNLEVIKKGANFRSVSTIVHCLNKMRPELPQVVSDPDAVGSVGIYYTNDWQGIRRTGSHWKDDLPSEVAHQYLETLKENLISDGWIFSPEKTKILMLTHNVLADEQGYHNLLSIFSSNNSLIEKEDHHFSFFADIVEPVCLAYENHRFGEMFAVLDRRTPVIRSHLDKSKWAEDMKMLLHLRQTGTVGEVIDHLKATKRPRLPGKVERKERELNGWLNNPHEPLAEEKERILSRLKDLRSVLYTEVIAASKFIDEKTPFATKHGVKGAEFENVLVVLGRGWNHYNFNQMLEWANTGIPSGKQSSYERNRNLFYVVCSRPKKRLALLFTQKLSDNAIRTLINWFGEDSIHSLSTNPLNETEVPTL